MPCYHPLRGWRAPFPNANGKYPLIGLKARSAEVVAPPGTAAVDVPCGQCIGCRLERSRKWAARCMLEASLYQENCFITLTYSSENLPQYGSLERSAFPKFMKRLRKRVGAGPRYFSCGEYGDQFTRPHYHAALFNFDFPDKEIFKNSGGITLFTSKLLSSLWPFGFSTVGDLTFDSAAYVARYVLKKVTGDLAHSHYTRLDSSTGELYEIEPEYVTMSRRPGIASAWFDKFSSDVFPSDQLVVRGFPSKPPRFFDSRYELDNKLGMELIREARSVAGYKNRDHSTLTRLRVREEVETSKLSQKTRSYEK